MAEPVTAAELAEALRELIGVTFNVVGTTERLRVFDASSETLSRFDVQQFEERKLAQQAEVSKPALSEVEKAAVKAVEAYDEANSGKLRSVMIVLSEALRKRGAW